MFEENVNEVRLSPVFGTSNSHDERGHTPLPILTSKEQELQKLLAEERQRSEQRKCNYQALKEEHIKLQRDFLTLQTDMKHILEETKLIKEQKENDLNVLKQAVQEKQKLIEKLGKDLDDRDPMAIKARFAQELQAPLTKMEKEKELVLREKEKLHYELKMCKQKIEHLEKELVDATDRARLAYEADINVVRREKEELRLKYLEVCQTPDNQRLLNLSEENVRLNNKVRGYQKTLEEAENQYNKIEAKLELILNQQEKSEAEHEIDTKAYKTTIEALREENINFDSLLKVNRRENEEIQKELKRCEKEVDKLKKEMNEKQQRFEDEKDKLKRLVASERLDCEHEKDAINEEAKKLKLEIVSKNEQITKLEQLFSAREKEVEVQMSAIKQQQWEKMIAIEREKTSLEVKLKEIKEEKSKLKEEIEQIRRQVETGMELRLSIEKDSLLLRAKVDTLQSSQEELEKLRRQYSTLQDDLLKIRGEYSESIAVNRELVRQKERYKDEYNRIKQELDEERKTMADYRVVSEKNIARLKACLEDERSEMRVKLETLQEEVKKKRKEREEIKSKCKDYASICEKLQTKLKQVKRNDEERKKEVVTLETHNQLKKQYKDLKKKQSQLSDLLNCSFDKKHCGTTDF